MESIAAPIEEIQFPTVTVCQDESKQPDNWAVIEAILNNVAFTCGDNEIVNKEIVNNEIANNEIANSEIVNNENPIKKGSAEIPIPCEDIIEIRKDFEFLITAVVEIFKKKIMTNNDTSLLKDVKERCYDEVKSFNQSRLFIAELVEKEKLTEERIFNLVVENFSKIVEVNQILGSFLQNVSQPQAPLKNISSASKYQSITEITLLLLCHVTFPKNESNTGHRQKRQFGAFLANFATDSK